MPSTPKDRSARSYFTRIRDLLVGSNKPCNRFGTFQALHDAVGSLDRATQNRAFECLYDRYLSVASYEARRSRLQDEEKAAEALDRVFVTMHQQIRSGNLQLEDEQHMKNYIRNGVRKQLIKDWNKGQKMQLLYDDDLSSVLATEGVHVESELGHLIISEAVERSLQMIGADCQKKLLLGQSGFKYDEIAEQLGIKAASVKSDMYKCRTRLKAELEKLGITFRAVKPKPKSTTNQDNATDDELE